MAAGKVRTWARQQGYEVGERGRIAPAIWEAYAAAHGEELADVRPQGLWRCRCGREWVGAVEAHCTTCHRHFSTPANFDAHRVGDPGRCVDPTERKLKERASVWGPIFVGEGEHYRTTERDGLFDSEGTSPSLGVNQ